MIKVSVRFSFSVFLGVIPVACQSAPGGQPTAGPAGGRTLPAGETPLATQPSPAPPHETAVVPEPSQAASTQMTGVASATPKALPAMIRFVNGQFGYQIDVPADSLINSEQLDLVRIDLPVTGGTTLSEKYLEISATRGQVQCSSPYAVGYDPAAIQSRNVVYHGIEFLEQSGSEGAAGSIYEFTSYSTQKDDLCLSLTFVLHSANPGMFETPPPPFDSPAEIAVFEEIMQTFAWTGA